MLPRHPRLGQAAELIAGTVPRPDRFFGIGAYMLRTTILDSLERESRAVFRSHLTPD
jgi:hypothetical protein